MFDDQGKTITTWLESSDSSTVFTRHCPFRCPFISVFKILLMEKIPISWKTVKGTEQFFAQKDKKLWEDGIMKLPEKWQRVVGKGLPRWHSGEASAGDITDGGLIPGLERSPGGGNGNPTPVFLPGIPWAEAPGHLLCPWGHREPDTTEWLSTHMWSRTKWWICCSIKFLMTMKNVSFTCTKNKGTFGHPINWRAKQSPDQGGLCRALECFPSMMEAIEQGWWNVLYVLRGSLSWELPLKARAETQRLVRRLLQ